MEVMARKSWCGVMVRSHGVEVMVWKLWCGSPVAELRLQMSNHLLYAESKTYLTRTNRGGGKRPFLTPCFHGKFSVY